MGRVYNKVSARYGSGATAVTARERPATVRQPLHHDRDVEASRHDVHREIDPSLFINPLSLKAPAPRPGWVQRWVSDGGDGTDAESAQARRMFVGRMRQGWQPRLASTVPPEERNHYMTAKSSTGDDIIRSGGLVLCETPVHNMRERLAAMEQLNQHQRESMPESTQEMGERMQSASRGFGPIQSGEREATAMGRQAPTLVD